MEATNHHVLEAVSLHDCPTLDSIRRDVLLIHGLIGAGVRIGTIGTNGCHQLVVFVSDGILRSLVGDGVNLMVDSLALSRVSGLAIHLIEVADFVE